MVSCVKKDTMIDLQHDVYWLLMKCNKFAFFLDFKCKRSRGTMKEIAMLAAVYRSCIQIFLDLDLLCRVPSGMVLTSYRHLPADVNHLFAEGRGGGIHDGFIVLNFII